MQVLWPESNGGGPGFVGASGIGYGLFGYVWMRPLYDDRFPIGIPPLFLIFGLLFILLGIANVVHGIANGAHVGGLGCWNGLGGDWSAGQQRYGEVTESNLPVPDPQDSSPATQTGLSSPQDMSLLQSIRLVLQIALPLMVSTGTASIVLFADRTLLLYHGDGSHMSAAMAGGNMYWTLVCFPIGIASMTGAIVAQYIGSQADRKEVGRFLWQSACWRPMAIPLFVLIALDRALGVSRDRPNRRADPAGDHLPSHLDVGCCGISARYRPKRIF